MTGPLASEFLPISGLMVEMRSRILAANLCERIAVHSRDAKRGDHHAFVTPPSFRKKLGYATWFVLVLILEYLIIRKQTEQWAEYREVGVVSSFKLRTQWLKMLLYLIIDVATLRNLRALPSMLGQSVRIKPFSQARKTVACSDRLDVPEETSLLVRHLLKLCMRIPPISAYLLGGKLTAFHGYNLKQLILMVGSPTFFSVMFAVRSREGLLKLAAVNVAFATAVALLAPYAFIHDETVHAEWIKSVGSDDPRGYLLTYGIPIVVVFPFVSVIMTPSLDPGMERQSARSGERGLTNSAIKGFTANGNSWLETSAVCFPPSDKNSDDASDDNTCSVIVHSELFGTMLRATFEGRVVSSRTLTSSVDGEETRQITKRTVLLLSHPTWGGPSPPVGLAHVSTIFPSSAERLADSSAQQGSGLTDFTCIGTSLPLLFVPTVEIADEINKAAEIIRCNIGVTRANLFISRLGSTLTPINSDEKDQVLEVVRAMSMHATEQMLINNCFQKEEKSEGSGVSHIRKGTGRRHQRLTSSSEDSDDDAVEGPMASIATGLHVERSLRGRASVGALLRLDRSLERRWIALSVWSDSIAWLLIALSAGYHAAGEILEEGLPFCKGETPVLIFVLMHTLAFLASPTSARLLGISPPRHAVVSFALVWFGNGVRWGFNSTLALGVAVTMGFLALNYHLRNHLFLVSLLIATCALAPAFPTVVGRTPISLAGTLGETSPEDAVTRVAEKASYFGSVLLGTTAFAWIVAREVQVIYVDHLLASGLLNTR